MRRINGLRMLSQIGVISFFQYVIVLFLICPSNYSFGQKVTFSEHIAPIIFENCTPCHRPNQIAPMPFTNYEEISAYASMIKYVTEIKYMPPWKATNSNHSFKDERGLSQHEINLIRKWVSDGVEEGNPSKTPSIPNFDDTPKMKNPDAVYSMTFDIFKVCENMLLTIHLVVEFYLSVL
ncbi:hypothetical protein OAU00_03300 [Saprospiraceae bacterium]|nr:hypothetical protein [Saprospiraceae bacterium]